MSGNWLWQRLYFSFKTVKYANNFKISDLKTLLKFKIQVHKKHSQFISFQAGTEGLESDLEGYSDEDIETDPYSFLHYRMFDN